MTEGFSSVVNRHVETVFVRAGEWVTIDHGLNSFEVVVSTYSMVDFSLIGMTVVHTDPNTIELTTSHYTYYEREDGTGELGWSSAQEDVYVRVMVLA